MTGEVDADKTFDPVEEEVYDRSGEAMLILGLEATLETAGLA